MTSNFYIVDLSLPASELVYGLINNDNDTNYRPDKVTLGEVSAVPSDTPRNSTLTLSRVNYPLMTLAIFYDRLTFEEVIDSDFPIVISREVGDVTTWDLINGVNEGLGFGLVSADIINAALDLGDPNVILEANEKSYAWLGQIPVLYLEPGEIAFQINDGDLLYLDDDTIMVGN
ncbi:virion structural protein [Klebsiella phage vB_KvM-Eowyn]|uniref:Uncharacterized protein n=1 Tax=Klebsiella phage vB_KvM-Eowyn TaxID=2762819 RepID=A0A7R8MJM5_9CAUD|nr:virion structural protein [Klebsiella phage vB_KvM-Eowyn]CAD5236227.1 hypothetical protein LLCLJKAH_00238 [Klebsiella phage vB_KvM-Eowyn]